MAETEAVAIGRHISPVGSLRCGVLCCTVQLLGVAARLASWFDRKVSARRR